MEQVAKIDDALAEYMDEDKQVARNSFPAAGPDGNQPIYRKCPNCNLDMVLRRKKDQGAFYISCINFPNCKAALWLPDNVLDMEINTEQKCRAVLTHP